MIALSNVSARQQQKNKNKNNHFNFRKLWTGGVSWNKGSQRRGFTLSHLHKEVSPGIRGPKGFTLSYLHNVQRILKRVYTNNCNPPGGGGTAIYGLYGYVQL